MHHVHNARKQMPQYIYQVFWNAVRDHNLTLMTNEWFVGVFGFNNRSKHKQVCHSDGREFFMKYHFRKIFTSYCSLAHSNKLISQDDRVLSRIYIGDLRQTARNYYGNQQSYGRGQKFRHQQSYHQHPGST